MCRFLVLSGRWCRFCAWLVLGAAVVSAHAAPLDKGGAAQALRETHARLASELAHSPLQRPLHLESVETANGLQGDVHAVVDHPLEEVRAALGNPSQWCEMLLLHINNRRCRITAGPGGGALLTLSVVRRYDKPVEEAFELPFVHRTVGSTPNYLAVDLSAESGPLGTSQYRVMLEAVPVGERRTFLHFGYAYDHNMMARLGTQAYLATFGSHKVGFTVTGRTAAGQPEYIRGLRGLMERNAMRYFLTLDAYLDGADAPKPRQFDVRLERWFASIERYPTQLHEVDLETYLSLKRADRQREAATPR